MADLSGQNIRNNRKGILNLGSTINSPLDNSILQEITDGIGTASPILISRSQVCFQGDSYGTDSTNLFNINQIWDTTGNPVAIKAEITNTASGGSALLMDLKVSGVSIFQLGKSASSTHIMNGNLNLRGNLSNSSLGYVNIIQGAAIAPSESNALGIGTTSVVASAKVQIDSTTRGFLPPRMTTTQINAIASPADGLVIYNTTIRGLCFYELGGGWKRCSHSAM
jgi:hypothetical protein